MLEQFKNPDRIYRGTDFWMLNDELNDDEIRWQIREFKEKGMNGFIARTYVGLRTDYPGPKWKHQIRVMLEEATKVGLRVTLQPLRMPGGFKESTVEETLDIIECVSKEMFESEDYKQSEYSTILAEYDDHYVVVHKAGCLPDKETGERYGGCLNMFDPEICQKYVQICYEENWEEFREYFGNTIHTMWVDEPLVPAHAIPYPNGIGEKFFERWGYRIEDNLLSLFYEIGDYKKVRYQYRVLLQRLMEKGYFQILSNWCKKNKILFSGHLFNEDSLITQIFGSVATMPFYKYLDIPGMDTLEADMEWRYGEIKPAYSRDYIGYDEIDGECHAPNGKFAVPMATVGMYTTPLQLTSASHQAGKEHILCEMFGVTTHNFTFRDQRHLFDHFAALGVNHKCIHAFFYNLHGAAKRSFPHQVNYYQPYWDRYADMYDHYSRTAWFISQGKPVKDVVMIHPLDTAYMMYDPSIDLKFRDNEELHIYERDYYGITRALCGAQCQFEFGDEATIGDWGKVTDNGFEIGQMTYKTVILPYLHVLRKSTLDLVCEYAKKGGKVYILGTMPTRVDGIVTEDLGKTLLDAGCEFVEFRADLIKLLENTNSSYKLTCTSDATPIIINHRADENRDYYFIMNDQCRDDKEITLEVKGKKKATRYIALSGTIENLPTLIKEDTTEIAIKIPEGGSIMFTLEDTNDGSVLPEEKSYFTKEISDRWDISKETYNVLFLDDCQYKRGESEEYTEKTYPATIARTILNGEEYEGDVYLRYTFNSNIETSLKLGLEDLDMCEIWFNGTPVEKKSQGNYVSHAIEVVALPETCKIGENEIVIKKTFYPQLKMGGLESNQVRVDFEPIFILGDFGVFSPEEPVNNGTHRFSRRFVLDKEKTTAGKDITMVGYPFYTGKMSFSKTIDITEEDLKSDKIMFTYEEFNGCTLEVIVNGESQGFVYWAPYEIDIKSGLKVGKNLITIRIANCMRNLFGPHHRMHGEVGHVWAENRSGGSIYNSPVGPWGGNPYDPEWYEHREREDNWWTPDYFMVPFGLGKVKLKLFK